MSESEKNDGGMWIPEVPDPAKEKRHKRTLTGLVFLSMALATLFGAESQWAHFAGFFLAGCGVFLLGKTLAACFALTGLAALNAFAFGAGWWAAFWSLVAGGVVAALFSVWTPDFRKVNAATIRFIVNKSSLDEEGREFAQIFAREFAPVLGFVLCVYTAFWFLGFLEELLTITIMAAFAWCGKMEKHYGGRSMAGVILANPDDLYNSLIGLNSVFSLHAFPSGVNNNPTINVSIARRGSGPIYFYVLCLNCPGKFNGFKQIYKFMHMGRLVKDVRAVIREELKHRNSSACWHTDWDALFFMLNSGSPVVGSVSVPMRDFSREAFLALVHIYFWFFIRHRYVFLGNLVGFIGESVGKIRYMFFKSDADARDTTRAACERELREFFKSDADARDTTRLR